MAKKAKASVKKPWLNRKQEISDIFVALADLAFDKDNQTEMTEQLCNFLASLCYHISEDKPSEAVDALFTDINNKVAFLRALALNPGEHISSIQ